MQNRRFRYDNARAARASRFAAELSDALHELRLTHKDVARELGITRYTVDSWTRAAEPTIPGEENLGRLCAALESRKPGLGAQLARIADYDWQPPPTTPETKTPTPLRALDASTPTNLPHLLSSFIGREREIAEVGELLGTSRLLTITGAGGIGKTSLSIKVAWELLGRAKDGGKYRDGIWLVELAPLGNPLLVGQTIANALGARADSTRPAIEALADHLRHKRLLLLLDNCEHLIDACATAAARLLTTCPNLTILATSREPLSITGELAWRLAALSMPAPLEENETRSLEELAGYEAVRLFIERACAVRPGFALVEENAPSIEEICRKLDGIPLAIELAAACLRFLSPQQVESGLDDRFRLLTGGNRDALPRHRTLKAAIDWSYDLLSEQERLLFRRLSAFAGGWDLQAAERVCADASLPGEGLVPLVGQLVSKSLVTADTSAEEARYRLLETLREYAREQLVESGEAEQLDRRLAGYCLWIAQTMGNELTGPDRTLWMGRTKTEHDNIRAALRWAIDRDEAPLAVEMAGILRLFWNSMGYLREGRRWLEEVIAMPSFDTAPPNLRSRALHSTGVLAYNLGDIDTAKTYYERSLAINREIGHKPGIAASLTTLGVLSNRRGDHDTAKRYLEEVVEIRRALGDKREIGVALHNLSEVSLYKGDYDEAIKLGEQNLAMFEEIREEFLIAAGLECLGLAYLRRGNYEQAVAALERSVTIFTRLDNNRGLPYAFVILGMAALRAGNLVRAQDMLTTATNRSFEIEDKGTFCESVSGLAVVALQQGDHKKAGRLAGIAEGLRLALNVEMDPPDAREYEINLEAARPYLQLPDMAQGESMTLELAMSMVLQALA